jgi:hypothetical protein
MPLGRFMVIREVMYLNLNDLGSGSTEANQSSLAYLDRLICPCVGSYATHTRRFRLPGLLRHRKNRSLGSLRRSCWRRARRRRMGTISAYSNSSSAIATKDPVHPTTIPLRSHQDMYYHERSKPIGQQPVCTFLRASSCLLRWLYGNRFNNVEPR